MPNRANVDGEDERVSEDVDILDERELEREGIDADDDADECADELAEEDTVDEDTDSVVGDSVTKGIDSSIATGSMTGEGGGDGDEARRGGDEADFNAWASAISIFKDEAVCLNMLPKWVRRSASRRPTVSMAG